MPLSILSVAFPFAAVGPDAVGGAEQVLAALDEALVARGHRSIVVAPAGSVVRGELVALPTLPPPRNERDWTIASTHVRRALAHVLARRRVDALHVHAYGFEHFLPAEGPPVLVTLHLPVSWYPPRALAPARPGVAFNCVSHAQKRLAPALGDAPLVPNGVAAHRFLCRRRKFPFALALGRICPEKGFHLAIAAATAARMPLVLAGRVFGYTSHEAYFRDHIAPTLGRACRFIGPAAFGRKRRLLAAARCLLVPSLVPE
jgi:glycosyltransferase involved in cell wall biosynthesis